VGSIAINKLIEKIKETNMSAEMAYLMAMSCAIPALVGIVLFKKIDSQYNLFVYTMILTAISETVVYITKSKFGNTNIWQLFVNVYAIIFFWQSIRLLTIHGFIKKQVVPWLAVGFVIVFIANFIYEHYSLKRVFFYVVCYLSCILIIVCTNILGKQTLVTNKKLVDNFWFWYSCFSIVSSAFALLIFALYYAALFNTPAGRSITYIHKFANMLCYIFFTVAVFKIPRKTQVDI
jgi:hypothetical protein